MPFIDWNNNGKIDPVDIGISIATEDEHNCDDVGTPISDSHQKPTTGCLTTVLTLSFVFVIVIVVVCLLSR